MSHILFLDIIILINGTSLTDIIRKLFFFCDRKSHVKNKPNESLPLGKCVFE